MARAPGGRNWKNAVDATAEVTAEATPAANIELLIAAELIVWDAITTPYAQPGLAFDGVDTGSLRDRHFGLMIAPAGTSARAWITRWGKWSDAAQHPNILIETTNSGGIPSAAAEVIKVAPGDTGTELYADFGAIQAPYEVYSGDDPDLTPGKSKDRQIELLGSLSPNVEVIRIRFAAGFGLVVVGRTEDLE